MQDDFTVGVEEEFLIVDAETRRLRPRAPRIMPAAEQEVGHHVAPELQRSQLETGTAVCRTLEEIRAEVIRLRRGLMAAAEANGSRIAAAGTHPFSSWDEEHQLTPKAAYLALERDYQQLTREQLMCGCHVHVGFADREVAIQVLNRVRPLLSPLLALTVNSPFWLGVDTGYGSFRTQMWRRWPTSGLPEPFESRADYEALVATMLATGSIDHEARIYWDVRPSHRFPTLEFRVSDVCLTVDETVMATGLVQALCRTCHAEAVTEAPPPRPRSELVRAAMWRAARYGVEADLVDVLEGRAAPAERVVDSFLSLLRPALEASGDWDEVSALVGRTMAAGTGASRQRQALVRSGRLEDVVDLAVAETMRF